MTCKPKRLATQGNAFLEGVLRVIMVTVALVTQGRGLAARKEGPWLMAALGAPGARRDGHMNAGGQRVVR